MITVILAVWIGFLWLLVKIGVFNGWSLWMKLSPIGVWVFAQLLIMLPMSWTAPAGPVTVTARSVEIIPSVAGIVSDVVAKSGIPIKKGDVLFKIDPETYQATVEQLDARLKLSELRLQQKLELEKKGAGRGVDVDTLQSEVKQLTAQLKAAKWNLENTTVTAPIDGFVPAIVLQPGARISPGAAAMALIDNVHQIVNVQLAQNHLRHVEVGQKAEVVFPYYPGHTFPATVGKIYFANPAGQLKPSGLAPKVNETSGERYVVGLVLRDPIPKLPVGASGSAAIYTSKGSSTHFIRQITLRMTTWLNFL